MSKSHSKKKIISLKVLWIFCTLFGGFLLAIYLSSFLHSHFKLSNVVSLFVSICLVISFLSLISLHKSSRCISLLMLVQLFNRKGRKAIVAYTFYLALTGPTSNLLKNVNVMSDSLTCGQVRRRQYWFECIRMILEFLSGWNFARVENPGTSN